MAPRSWHYNLGLWAGMLVEPKIGRPGISLHWKHCSLLSLTHPNGLEDSASESKRIREDQNTSEMNCTLPGISGKIHCNSQQLCSDKASLSQALIPIAHLKAATTRDVR